MIILFYLIYLVTYSNAINDLPITDLPINCHWSHVEQHLVVCTGIPNKPIYTQLVLYNRKPFKQSYFFYYSNAWYLELHLDDCNTQFLEGIFYLIDQRNAHALQRMHLTGCFDSHWQLIVENGPSALIYIPIVLIMIPCSHAIESILAYLYKKYIRRSDPLN
jgi:hypothetical protein